MDLRDLAKLGVERRKLDNAHEVYRKHWIRFYENEDTRRDVENLAAKAASKELGIKKQEMKDLVYLHDSLK